MAGQLPRRRTVEVLQDVTGPVAPLCGNFDRNTKLRHLALHDTGTSSWLMLQLESLAHEPQAEHLSSDKSHKLSVIERPHAAQCAPVKPGQAFAAASATPVMLLRTASTSARSTRTPARWALQLTDTHELDTTHCTRVLPKKVCSKKAGARKVRSCCHGTRGMKSAPPIFSC
jgi:hypothetical protein